MTDQLAEPTELADDAGRPAQHARQGFFTDTSICIGCKACEVACKEWNHNPTDSEFELLGSSYDNTGGLGANTWRHVAFVEQDQDRIEKARESGRALVDLGMPGIGPPETKSAAPSAGRPQADPVEFSVFDIAAGDTAPPDTRNSGG